MRSCDDYNMRGDSEESGKAAASECDVGLGLNMQYAESTYPSKNTNFMSHPSPYHYREYRACTKIGGGNGSLLLFDDSTATSNQTASGNSFKYSAGGETGKLLFTAAQWQEFESQRMIYKYIMASIPVPPQLLLPQSNRSGTDLRFSSGSDPEPWRCRRTDGKKWRCSRDVVPDQKYCERHSHKNRPRSRKPVETQSHNAKTNTLSSKDNYHPLLPPAAPSMPISYQQSRCTEWFMKSGTIPLSSSSQKIQKPIHSPGVGSKRDHFCQHLEGNHQDESHLNFLNNITSSVASAASARRQHLIGALSRSGGDDCSLTLSMQPGGSGICEDHDFFQMGIGMLNADKGGNADVSNSDNQWVNQASWLGGPLGEALCLGMASTLKGPPNVPSPHGYSNSATSSCSCQDDGGCGLN